MPLSARSAAVSQGSGSQVDSPSETSMIERGALVAEVGGGLLEGVRDRRLAVRLVAVHRREQLVAVVGTRRHDLLAVLAGALVLAGEHGRAEHPQTHLGVGRERRHDLPQRRLGSRDLGLTSSGLLGHRARRVEQQHHAAVRRRGACAVVRAGRRGRGHRHDDAGTSDRQRSHQPQSIPVMTVLSWSSRVTTLSRRRHGRPETCGPAPSTLSTCSPAACPRQDKDSCATPRAHPRPRSGSDSRGVALHRQRRRGVR